MLKWNLNSFTISYFFKPCTIIPNSLYDSKLKRKYLELNNQIDSSEEVLVDKSKTQIISKRQSIKDLI